VIMFVKYNSRGNARVELQDGRLCKVHDINTEGSDENAI